VDITNRILWLNVASPLQSTMHVYEVRPRKDKRGVNLISEALPFGGLWQFQQITDPASVIAASERIVPRETATER